MKFDSLTFILFFLIVLALHSVIKSWHLRKVNLLIASFVFYAAWNPFYIMLIWISTILDWILAKQIAGESIQSRRRSLLFISLGVNLGLLGYFKYGGFLLDNFVSLLEAAGYQYTPPEWDIILPIGISFYTFQTLSYTIDVYRGKLKPSNSLLDFSLYVCFFPQLVAGPIVRAAHFLPQCLSPRQASIDQLGWGASLIVLGLFSKLVLSDSIMAPIADTVFNNAGSVGTLEAWAGVFAFSCQIFFDFSGYSTCAIGTAMCLGFILPDNFRSPYAAIGFSDFWRRWHISLSSWLRDYLYIPLGGSRHGYLRTLSSLMATMLLGGLWHGPSWLFALWGMIHGLYLVSEHILRKIFSEMNLTNNKWVRQCLIFTTFLLVSITWVFFRSADLTSAINIFTAMFNITETSVFLGPEFGWLIFTLPVLLIWHQMTYSTSIEDITRNLTWPVRTLIISTVILSIIFSTGDDRAFIYFQF